MLVIFPFHPRMAHPTIMCRSVDMICVQAELQSIVANIAKEIVRRLESGAERPRNDAVGLGRVNGGSLRIEIN
jgi:hypothetical protein